MSMHEGAEFLVKFEQSAPLIVAERRLLLDPSRVIELGKLNATIQSRSKTSLRIGESSENPAANPPFVINPTSPRAKKMGLLSYVVLATARTAGGDFTPPDQVFFDTRAFSEHTRALLDVSSTIDPSVTVSASTGEPSDSEHKKIDATAQAAAAAEARVSLSDVAQGPFFRIMKAFAYVTGSNAFEWTTVLDELHAQQPALQLRVHLWYDEDMMTFFEVGFDGAPALCLVHAASCRSERCCGWDCRDATPHFWGWRRLVRQSAAGTAGAESGAGSSSIAVGLEGVATAVYPRTASFDAAALQALWRTLDLRTYSDVQSFDDDARADSKALRKHYGGIRGCKSWRAEDESEACPVEACGDDSHSMLSVTAYLASVDDATACRVVRMRLRDVATRAMPFF